jgi:hypothetical protein
MDDAAERICTRIHDVEASSKIACKIAKQPLIVGQGTIDHAREKNIVYYSVPAKTRCRRYAGVWRKEAHPVP